jgi:hypothetical protein
MTAHLDPQDLSEVRRRVVEPVVRSVIQPDELGDVLVYVDNGDVYVRVIARDELVTWCFLGPLADAPWDAVERADRFYDGITDELPSTTFAWGEQREGRYQVPGPIGPPRPGD